MDAELERVRGDLETIRSAAGFGDPPLGRHDVWGLVLLGIVSFAFAVCAWAVHGIAWQHFVTLALVLSLVAVLVNHWYVSRRKSTAAADRAYRFSWGIGLLLGVVLGAFYMWAKFYSGIGARAFLSASSFLIAAVLLTLAVTNSWRKFFWGLCLPLFIFAFAAFKLPDSLLQAGWGAAVGLGCFAAAAIMRAQLCTTSR